MSVLRMSSEQVEAHNKRIGKTGGARVADLEVADAVKPLKNNTTTVGARIGKNAAARTVRESPKSSIDESRGHSTERSAAAAPKPEYEKWLHNQLLGAGVLVMELEYQWARGRKYRADIAFPEHRLIVEINGAAHRIKGRFKDDILKHQEAILQGWVLLPVSTAQVRDASACTLVKRVLALLMAKGVPF